MFNKIYAQFYDLFSPKRESQIKFIYRWANRPNWIFDIGCGTASYWQFYPGKTNILGIDKSSAMAGKFRNIICADVTKYKHKGTFDCATALYDVLNYIPKLDWFKNIPVRKGGYFIFEIWDKKKVDAQGFRTTTKRAGDIIRTIWPEKYNGKSVTLNIQLFQGLEVCHENHKMYVHSHEDIVKACGKEFEIVSIKETNSWQRLYKCRRK